MNTRLPDNSHPTGDPVEAAAQWLARQDTGLSPAEAAELASWRRADERHEAAWQEVSSTWRAFDRLQEQGLADDLVRALAHRQHRRRWRRSIAVASGLAAGVAAAVAVMFIRPDPSRGMVSRTEHRVLDDGSTVELNRDAKIEVDYRPDRRGVRLVRGEALFTVAKNSSRPFIVSTGRVDVQAVGTAFAVSSEPEMTAVLVTEGRVAVERAVPSAATNSPGRVARNPVLVDAGDRLQLPTIAVPEEKLLPESVSGQELEQLLAWRGPRLELANTRLSDAVALMNRESPTQLRVLDPALGELRLSGVFRADNAEGFARLLEANYEVLAESKGGTIELRSK